MAAICEMLIGGNALRPLARGGSVRRGLSFYSAIRSRRRNLSAICSAQRLEKCGTSAPLSLQIGQRDEDLGNVAQYACR